MQIFDEYDDLLMIKNLENLDDELFHAKDKNRFKCINMREKTIIHKKTKKSFPINDFLSFYNFQVYYSFYFRD